MLFTAHKDAAVDYDGTRLIVRADDSKMYEIFGSQVTNLEEQK